MLRLLTLCVISLACTFIAHDQDFSAYQKSMLVEGKDTLRYRILYPLNYQQGTIYPVIIILHGSGERGRNNESQLAHGADLFLKPEIRQKYPAIVIFPQCPDDTVWSYFQSKESPDSKHDILTFPFQSNPAFPERMVKELTDDLINKGEADPHRIYLGGLSLGGFGTYDLLIRYPGYYAAAFPICGACNVSLFAKKAKKTPLWIFHGAKDDVVDPAFDRELFLKLKNAHAPVKYTEFPEANHNSWDPAFAEPDLLPWLFAQHR
jgi:predicted peptidase